MGQHAPELIRDPLAESPVSEDSVFVQWREMKARCPAAVVRDAEYEGQREIACT